MIHVPDDGPLTARIVLIGEAPGKKEVAAGKPFVGPSGWRLEVWWRKFGLCRSDFYITNVVPYLPDDIDKVPREEMEGHIAALRERLAALKEPWLIVPVGNYALYALTGKGKVSWHDKDGRHARPGISDWRGSILSGDINGRVIKCIPTLHPAFVLREPGYERRCLADWARIAEEAKTPVIDVPVMDNRIRPSLEDVKKFVADAKLQRYLAVDIETPRKWATEYAVKVGETREPGKAKKIGLASKCHGCGHTNKSHEVCEIPWGDSCPPVPPAHAHCKKKLCACNMFIAPATPDKVTDLIEYRTGVKRGDSAVVKYKTGAKKGQPKGRKKPIGAYVGCVGFAYNTRWSFTVPTTRTYWGDKLPEVLGLLAELLTGPVGPEIVMQNGFFDASWMAWEFGWDVKPRYKWDTRAMHHALDPRDDHDLAYMASILTRIIFWKHEAKDPDEIEKYASNTDALWSYNGIDCCATLEIFFVLLRLLREEGMLHFYLRHYAALIAPLLDMNMHGVNVDKVTMDRERIRLDALCADVAAKLEAEAGESLIGDGGGISNTKLAHYLYTTLKLPKQTKRGKGGERSITTDEYAVRRLLQRYPKKLSVTGPWILEYRKTTKQREFLDSDALDARDGRMRCQYSFVTEAGRLASHGTGWGTGRNLQNIDRELRYVFIPDEE